MVNFLRGEKMEISEVRVKLINNKDDRLKAFCSITMDNEFVVRDIKVIEGSNGFFVAMPSRKMSDHCEKCGGKNHLRAKFCNNCGASLSENRAKTDIKGRMKLHADIAHPINAQCRKKIQDKVIESFKEELEKSKEPGYKPTDLDEPDYDIPEIV
jgi:stage V sporulation protein G